MYKLSASEIRTFADITKYSQNTHSCTVYSICMLFRGYHTAVFISACISSPSVYIGLGHSRGQLSESRASYIGTGNRYGNNCVITSLSYDQACVNR